MLSAYVNASDMEGAERFFTRIKQDGVKPNFITYGTLIKGYAKKLNVDKMMEKYEEMQMQGVKPNQTILTTIMDAYGKNKGFDFAVIWYKEMESRGLPPDQKAKNILLSLAKTAEEQKEANKLLGLLDQFSNEQGLNSLSRFVDEDTEDDDDEYDSYIKYDSNVSDLISSDDKQEVNCFTGNDQQKIEVLIP